jgi:AbrB family looped-hinge helix DNA binding protein
MSTVETTKMTSKGQIVIPEETRNRLGLKAGDKFLVVGDKDIVILKMLTRPSLDEFDNLIKLARKRAKAVGLKKSDISKAIVESRKR